MAEFKNSARHKRRRKSVDTIRVNVRQSGKTTTMIISDSEDKVKMVMPTKTFNKLVGEK